MEMIRTENLCYSYDNTETNLRELVLDELRLAIREGSFVAILGRNGSGKSTLARHFNGILLPSGGKVFISGMDTADETLLTEIRRTVGVVFQNPDNQLVASVVEEDVAFAPENLGVAPEEIRKRVDAALSTVGMTDWRAHAPHRLSGGQKQRVAIAGILAMEPKCIVLDEPTAMLDPAGRQEVLQTVRRLNRDRGITVILITHHMEEAVDTDRVIVLSAGRIALDGSPREIFPQVELLRELGLAVPETTALLYRLRQAGLQLPLDALSVDECAAAIYTLIR